MPDSGNPDELFIRLYLDRHVKLKLADDLRARAFDVLTTQEAAMDTASDEGQLAFAANRGRAILTFNVRDFAPLHGQWTSTGRSHAGIVVSQQLGGRQYGVLLGRSLRLLVLQIAIEGTPGEVFTHFRSSADCPSCPIELDELHETWHAPVSWVNLVFK